MIKSHQALKNILIIFFSTNLKLKLGILKIIFNPYLVNVDYGLIIKKHHTYLKSKLDPKNIYIVCRI